MQPVSPDFLSSLRFNVDKLTTPFLNFDDENYGDVEQNSDLLTLPDNVLDGIMSYIPLKERLLCVGVVCKKLRESAIRSVTSVAFFKDGIDELDDKRIQYFLHLYGANVKYLNFDLYRSSTKKECSQWTWRPSVVSAVSCCKNLRELNILVSHRHRLRDGDLIKIFDIARGLESLSIDGQYLSGHCFASAPPTLKKLEMEMCHQMKQNTMKNLFSLRNLEVLHLSRLIILRDNHIYELCSRMKKLRELSLVSEQDAIYPDLTPRGLAYVASLPHLETLCLEGLSTVTDSFLQDLISTRYPLYRNLKSLSLAYCFNFGNLGLKALASMVNLENLNLDGVSRRDISAGLEIIARNGNLVRLLLSENCNVSPETLIEVAIMSGKLRLLDITNNEQILNWHCAHDLIFQWDLDKSRKLLTILTDVHLPWNMVIRSHYVPSVQVVHVRRDFIPPHEISPDSILSDENVFQLPSGLLIPELRRGNRFRLLSTILKGDDEDKENGFTPSPPTSNKGHSPPTRQTFSDVSNRKRVFGEKHKHHQSDKFQCQDTVDAFSMHMLHPPKVDDFSDSPLAFDKEPQKKDWSLDVLSLLLRTHTYDDGAAVRDIDVKEGVVFKKDGMVSNPDAVEPSSTTGRRSGGGAPRPPVQIPAQPSIHYTRGPRAKRRSHNNHPSHSNTPTPGPTFNASDFPPLK